VRKILGRYPIVRLRKIRADISDRLEEHGKVLVFLIMSTGSHCSEFTTPDYHDLLNETVSREDVM